MAFEIQLYNYIPFTEEDNLDRIIASLPEPSEYLSHLWRTIGHEEDDFEEAVCRAKMILQALHIPEELNFKKIFRSYDGHTILADYKISELGSFLIIMNGNPLHETTAGFQLNLIQSLFNVEKNYI
ncbi:hypothetical protein MYP_3839 [Sporocytophaga myxococcoides]|uniref:Uncharacterized protein n=1 Tax=Sporocytophaga myxococcoides TaxID=153721 RepID=A0A098LJF0_9BACT|nr:hypothetical protein [Sporocytophaga myxococcoides]GAL86609.1 hypothetical protein MYP_3839 [Sporocytophaga myxococcoides]